MTQPPPDFDDPNLKTTVHRALIGQTADPALKSKISDLLARETSKTTQTRETTPSSIPIRRPILRWTLAAAAILLVGVALPVLWRHHLEQRERDEEMAANLPVFQAMVETFNQPAAPAADLPVTDPAALRTTLSTKLGRPVPVPDWSAKGWRLTSATIAPVASHPAAQLRYENGNRKILFLSLAANAWKEADEGEEHAEHKDHAEPELYEYTLANHPIVGFTRDAGLHCTIGDTTFTAKDLISLKVN
jgi:anti-sigma factor RsiW